MTDRLTDAELERIYDDTIVELYGYVSRRCGGQRELAEDVTQEAWVRALRHWRQHGVPANPLGWLGAFGVSFVGHHRLTFADSGARIGRAALRFFAISAAGFVVNEAAYASLLAHGALGYRLALGAVLVAVAGFTYAAGRRWAFARTAP